MPVSKQGNTSGRFTLEVSGVSVGFLKNREGGDPSSVLVKERNSPAYFVGKHLGPLYYEPLILQFDLSLDKAIYDWIGTSWQGKHGRRDGRITTYDVNQKPLGEQDFFQALITETTIPALDASSKDAAYLTLKLAPEHVKLKFGEGAAPPALVKNAKAWQVSNFALNIDGLECKRVSKIDALTVKQEITTEDIGISREPQKSLPIDFPDLHVTFPVSDLQTWYNWFEDFVVQGNSDTAHEKTGNLVFLAPDRKTELARINFFGLGIYKLVTTMNDQQIAASLYCERMEFVYPTPPA